MALSDSNLKQPQAGPVRSRASVRRLMLRMATGRKSDAVLSDSTRLVRLDMNATGGMIAEVGFVWQ